MAKSNKSKISLPVLVIAVIVILVSVISSIKGNITNSNSVNSDSTNTNIVIHYIDVGQGDCSLVELPNGQSMLIDAGTKEYADKICSYISSLGYSKIDYLVATHPHSDHIGGMIEVVNSFDIGQVYMPRASHNSKTFENLLTSISNKGLSINTAKAGVQVLSNDNTSIDFIAPVGSGYDDLNNYSAVVRIKHGKNSFLFMGDAEDVSENEILANGSSLNADVLKVGHHGSRYSSTKDFLNAVSPKYAVISCGKDNSYGHPHKQTLNKLSNIGSSVYITYEKGTITITCDGNDNFDVDCEK